jgi:hypothetical protein
MPAPVNTSIRLPDDSGNAGARVRTRTRSVGGSTVHEHLFTPLRAAEVLGVYRVVLPQQTILQAAQNGTATGFLWFHVPAAVTGKKVRIRKVRVSTQHSTALATPTAPRLVAQLFAFTGTASGATVAPGKNDSGFPNAVADLRTAVTGLTVSLGAVVGVYGVVGALTAVGAWVPVDNEAPESDEEDGWIVLAPGEGIVLYQDVAGTASDTRKANVTVIWDEIDVS